MLPFSAMVNRLLQAFIWEHPSQSLDSVFNRLLFIFRHVEPPCLLLFARVSGVFVKAQWNEVRSFILLYVKYEKSFLLLHDIRREREDTKNVHNGPSGLAVSFLFAVLFRLGILSE